MDLQHTESKIRPKQIENNDFLFRLGIYIPGKEKFQTAVIKYKNSDFIVEEILPDGSLATIDYDDNQNNLTASTFYHATLVKNNLRTTDAAREIARQLGIRIEDIGYYGLKDDDALTAQRISIKNTDISKLLAVRHKNFFLKDLQVAMSRLTPGQNTGNRFSVIVRFEQEPSLDKVNHVFSGKEFEFANYFYTQRFLTPRLSNFYWSVFLLQGNPEEAVKQFLTQSNNNESPFEKSVRSDLLKHYGNWDLMYSVLENNNQDRFFDKEILVVDALRKNPDPIRALNAIPDQVKIWLYSISSWFFNHKIAELLKSGGNIPDILPMYLSNQASETTLYKEFAEKFGIYPPNTAFIKKYFNVDSFGSKVSTHAKVRTISAKQISSKSLKLVFDLSTGAYATTFLSNFVNLISGDLNAANIEKDEFVHEVGEENPLRIKSIELLN